MAPSSNSSFLYLNFVIIWALFPIGNLLIFSGFPIFDDKMTQLGAPYDRREGQNGPDKT